MHMCCRITARLYARVCMRMSECRNMERLKWELQSNSWDTDLCFCYCICNVYMRVTDYCPHVSQLEAAQRSRTVRLREEKKNGRHRKTSYMLMSVQYISAMWRVLFDIGLGVHSVQWTGGWIEWRDAMKKTRSARIIQNWSTPVFYS